METIVERPAALDVHKAQVTACARVPGVRGRREQHVAEFPTTVRGLLALRDWLAGHGVSQVVMEATGVYWKAPWAILEDEFECMLVNARHVKQVPGRKTDVSDAAWLCQLAEAGLLKANFVPPKPIRELRNLTRYRKTQIQERAREVNRLHKALEDAGIKLDTVAADIMGKSGRDMLDALVAGETDPNVLAELARRQMRKKIPALRDALAGHFDAHHRLWVGAILRHIDFLDEQIEQLTGMIEQQIRPFAPAVELLCTMTGIQHRGAQCIIGEIGTDMTQFATARHLASWAGRCPGNDKSAGKRRSGKTRDGSKWLNFALEEAANGRDPRQGPLPRSPIPAAQAPPRAQAGPRGRQAHDDLRDLAHALHRRDLPRPRRRLLHKPRPRTPNPTPRHPARTPRTPRHAHRGGRGSLSELFLSGTCGSARGSALAAARSRKR